MSARSGRRRGGPTAGEQARGAIVEATVATLAEDGFSGTSARAVAARAGIAPGGVFYHFGSMDDLLAAVFAECVDRRIARMSPVLDVPGARVPDVLREVVTAEISHPESRALLEVVVGATGSPVLAAHVRAGIERTLVFTRQVVDRLIGGTALAALLPLDLVAEVAASAFFGYTVLDQVGFAADVDSLAALVALLTGLGAGTAATGPPEAPT
jgi:AcrR family transcriptional regulator